LNHEDQDNFMIRGTDLLSSVRYKLCIDDTSTSQSEISVLVWFMVHNMIFNIITVISWNPCFE